MAAEIYVTILTGFGLGHLLHYGRELNAMDQVIGIMLVIVAIGLLADKLIFSPWSNSCIGAGVRDSFEELRVKCQYWTVELRCGSKSGCQAIQLRWPLLALPGSTGRRPVGPLIGVNLTCRQRSWRDCSWPEAPVRGDAAIRPLSVEHRTLGGAANTAAPDPLRSSAVQMFCVAISLFDHPVGAAEDRAREGEATHIDRQMGRWPFISTQDDPCVL